MGRRNWATDTLELRASQHSCVCYLSLVCSSPQGGHSVIDTDLEDRRKPGCMCVSRCCCRVKHSSPAFVEKKKKTVLDLVLLLRVQKKPVLLIYDQ